MEKQSSNSSSSTKKAKFPSQKFSHTRKKEARESGNTSSDKLPVLKQLKTYKRDPEETECLLCSSKFLLPQNIETFLSHLLCDHNFVIADVHCIADFKGYIDYWRSRLCFVSLLEICTTMHAPVKEKDANPHIEGESREFFLLSDILPEDRLLREGLQEKRLEWILQQQQFEREDVNYEKGCLMCRTVLKGTRANYLDHLSTAHNLQLGRAANLVFIDELVDQIEKYFDKFQCIYCEKFFTDRLVLREHMRKKMHKRINPCNHMFDQYYSVNYLEMGKNWVQVANEKEEPELGGYTSGSEAADGDVADWDDWNETSSMAITCLFCDVKSELWDTAMQHLLKTHKFDFPAIVGQLDFYQKVKLVNYIRNLVEKHTCIICEEKFPSAEDLLTHMENSQHFQLPSRTLWDRAEYFFPTHEDDGFLCQLDDGKADDDGTPDCVMVEEPNQQLQEALVEGRLSEVIGLKAELSQTSAIPASSSDNAGGNYTRKNPPYRPSQHVTFLDLDKK